MRIDEYISDLRSQKIFVSVQENQVAVKDPNKALTPHIIDGIRARKTDILAFFNSINNETSEMVSIPKAPESKYYPLSSAQKRMYFLYEFDKEGVSYNMPSFMTLSEEFKVDKLESVFNKLATRHQSLRTVFELVDGVPMQRILEGSTFKMERFSIIGSEVDAYKENFVRPFDLANDYPVRVSLLEIEGEDPLLMMDMHHIVNDGVSTEILMREFWMLFQDNALPKLDIQYTDYAVWQQSEKHQELVTEHKAYWMGRFSEELPSLNLPIDHPRTLNLGSQGDTHSLTLSQKQSEQLRAIASAQGVTMYNLFLSLYNILLYKLSNQENIVVGTPTAGRYHTDLEGLVGMFVNTLVLRNTVKSELSFIDFISNIQEETLRAFDHQLYQYEELVDALQVPRDVGRNPLFNVFFSYSNKTKGLDDNKSGMSMNSEAVDNKISKFDLSLAVLDSDAIGISFTYRKDLFNDFTIVRFSNYLERIIDLILLDTSRKLGDFDILSEKEKNTLLVDFNNTAIDYDLEKTVLDLFLEQSAKTPNAEAIVFGEERLSYQELNTRSDLWANYLVGNGVVPGSIVGLITTRSSELITGILAIMKSGAAYLPINPDQPVSRTLNMLEECESTFVITNIQEDANNFSNDYTFITAAILDSYQLSINKKQLPLVTPNSLAYVIYTSGSTGKPKGVLIEHKGLTNLNNYQRVFFKIDTSSRILQFSPYYFDASVEQVWLALAGGATLVLISKETFLNQQSFNSYLINNEITYLHSTPSFLENIKVDKVPSLQIVISGGEKCKPALANKFIESTRFINEYGPTEGTVASMAYEVLKPLDVTKNVPIGKPISNVQAYVLDNQLNLLPIGVSGELYIGGNGLSSGYLNRVDLTAERFINNPFGPGKLYKTGDLVKWLADGNLEFTGRTDDQVKIRGYRIELGEIESQLEVIDGLQQALVVVRGAENNKQLVAYLCGEETLEIADIKLLLSKTLPEYMIPTGFVWLDFFPVTANGKVDKRALPSPDLTAQDVYIAAENPQQEELVTVWSEVLSIDADKISITSDFFNLGGHSLLAITLVNKVNKIFSINLPLRDLFTHRTIKELALHVLNLDKVSFVSIPKAAESEYYPLSSAQKRMYFLYEFDKEGVSYNMPSFMTLSEEFRVDKLESVFNKLATRHQSLRTAFELVDGVPMQRILDGSTFKMERFSIIGSEVDTYKENFVRPFDLANDYPVRVSLLEIEGEDPLLMMDMHHIVNDGVSTEILMRELWMLFQDNALPKLDIQYTDYAVWQQSESHQELVYKHKTYWIDRFSEELPSLNLPIDYPRTFNRGSQGDTHSLTLSQTQSEQLRAIASSQGVTMYNLFLSLYNILLYKISNQEDIVVGTPTAGRHHTDLEGLVGMFVNTLVLRNTVNRELSFIDFLSNVQEDTLMAFDHQLYQYEELVDALQVPRDVGRNPLFDVFFSYGGKKDGLDSDLLINGDKLTTKNAKFDLELDVLDSNDCFDILFTYNVNLFTGGTVKRFSDFFQCIINEVLINEEILLSEIVILTNEEKNKLIHEFNDLPVDRIEGVTIVNLIEEQVLNNPGANALILDEDTLSYEALSYKSNQLAHYLIEDMGVKSGDRIGLHVNRSFDMIIGFLAVLKAGATYVALDTAFPWQRIDMICQDADIKLVLTNSSEAFSGIESEMKIHDFIRETSVVSEKLSTLPGVIVKESAPAYIIYTSGTTGRPKGLVISRNSLLDYSITFKERFHLLNSDKVIQQASPSFDTVVEEVFPALIAGASLVIMPEGGRNIVSLVEAIIRTKATILSTVPIVLHAMNDFAKELGSLRLIISGGDLLVSSHIDKLIENSRIFNTYGPSESTVCITYHEIDSLEDASCIGKPITNRQVYILNKDKQLCPIGVVGELCVSGKGLATKYLNDEYLTNMKFIDNPIIPGARMYCTGDAAKWNKNGTITFVGRIDDQVKIRGVRIELGEIESQLEVIDGVQQALVVVRGAENNKQLVAYLCGEETLEIVDIKLILSKTLPEYMIPTGFVWLDDFPVTSNGKVDKRALPSPDLTAQEVYVSPENEGQEQLVVIWSEVLSIDADKISVTSDFFNLGGHSLLAMKLQYEINNQLEFDISLFEIFLNPTILALEAKMNESKTIEITESIVIPLNKTTREEQFFVIHDGSGEVNGYLELTRLMVGFQCYGIKFGEDDTLTTAPTIVEIASKYISEIKMIQAEGPYHLLGWSLGGEIVVEMTQQLEQAGETVENLIIVDSVLKYVQPSENIPFDVQSEIELLKSTFGFSLDNQDLASSLNEVWSQFSKSETFKVLPVDGALNVLPENIVKLIPDFLNKNNEELFAAANKIRLLIASSENHFIKTVIEANTLYIRPFQSDAILDTEMIGQYFLNLDIQYVSGDHFSVMKNPNVIDLVKVINNYLGLELVKNEMLLVNK